MRAWVRGVWVQLYPFAHCIPSMRAWGVLAVISDFGNDNIVPSMHASRLIGAAEVVANLNVTRGLHLPDGERQVRPLTVLEPEQQRGAQSRRLGAMP